MQDKRQRIDEARFAWLHAWLIGNGIAWCEGETFPELRHWAFCHGILQHIKMSRSESEPFVAGSDFYGPTFEAVVDAEMQGHLVSERKRSI